MRKFLIATAALVVAVSAYAIPARAQEGPTAEQCAEDPGYPGCPAPEVVTIFLGTLVNVGDQVQGSACGFADGVSREFNGTDAGDRPLDANGCYPVTIRLTRALGTALGGAGFAVAGLQLAQADAPQVSINGQTFTARQGRNDLTIFGVSSSPLNPDREVHLLFDIGRPSGAAAGGTLARTGATILRWSLAAFALLAVGTLLVLADRRRKAAPIRDDRNPRI